MIDDLKNSSVIVKNTNNDLIVFYINPRNFRQNKKEKWTFDCDSFYAFMPMWVQSNRVEHRKPPKERESKVLTDTIIHPSSFMTLEEWMKNTENAHEVVMRIFE